MDYRYLETTGVLNEASSGPGGRHRRPPISRPGRGRAGKGLSWRGKPVPREVCGLVPESLARENMVFPIGEDGETLLLAAVAFGDVGLADKISFVIARPVRLVAASLAEVESLVRDFFGEGSDFETADSMLQEFSAEALSTSTLHHHGLAPVAFRALEAVGPKDFSRAKAARRDASGPRSRSGLDSTFSIPALTKRSPAKRCFRSRRRRRSSSTARRKEPARFNDVSKMVRRSSCPGPVSGCTRSSGMRPKGALKVCARFPRGSFFRNSD
jgi:hypothetical protein